MTDKEYPNLFEQSTDGPAEQPSTSQLRLWLLSDLGKDLVEHFRSRGRAVSWINHWKAHAEPYFGALAANSVSSEHVADYVDRRRKEGATDITIETELGFLIRIYTFAVENGKLFEYPQIKRPHARWLRRVEKRKAEREEAAQIALQDVHDCVNCRKVLYQLFLVKPAAIEKYHKHVKAAIANASTSVQSEKQCECCGRSLVVGTHGNSKLCIPCKIVRADESKRENSRRHRAKQRGDTPVEELRRCIGCKEKLEPDPETGKIHGSRKYCPKCAERRKLLGHRGWKKKKSAKARVEAGHPCPGKKIVDGQIRDCGEWVVPANTMHQKFCSRECADRTEHIRNSLDPEKRKYYRDYARRMRERAWRPEDWEDWPVLATGAGNNHHRESKCGASRDWHPYGRVADSVSLPRVLGTRQLGKGIYEAGARGNLALQTPQETTPELIAGFYPAPFFTV